MSSPKLELVLPDGTRLAVAAGSTALDVARGIGPGLAAAALAAQLDDVWVDLRAPLESGGHLRLITARDPEAGEVIRHSAEHVMADAVKRLWPATQIDVGRSGRDGKFQYDFDIPERIGRDDLARIEAEMQRIIDADLPFERDVVPHAEAQRVFSELGDQLKVSRIGDLSPEEQITLYRHGDFVDVCRGPHVQTTGQIGAFQLTDLAGSYWRGDESNKMLQRVYGVAFSNKKELKKHLALIEEAQKRDHRKLGAELDLFMLHEWAPGSPFYLPKGVLLYNGLVDYVRGLYRTHGYDEVISPQIFRSELFKTSGHWDNFGDDMFRFSGSEEDEELGVKPMNCPGHCLMFRGRKRSYRELPLRLAEFSRLHRNERSGTLHGLSRVRSMAQDDAHIYCEWDQLEKELDNQMQMTADVYRDFGLEGRMGVATRPDKFIGDPGDWDHAETMLVQAVQRAGFECTIKPGEGAFYAPKIECDVLDALGRSWQVATIQVDMAMPQRFELAYVGSDGEEHTPAMVHRAVLGSLERFIALYLEHTGGNLPTWLAPQQVAILPVSERHHEAANKVREQLFEANVRVEVDARNETLGYRVRHAETQKIPYTLVIGDAEASEGSVTIRRRHSKEQEKVAVDQFLNIITEEVETRGIS